MKKYILGAVLSLGILVSPAFTQAAALTSTQISAIVSLLQSFGADAATIANVSASLNGGTTTTGGGTQPWCHTFNTDLTIGSSGIRVFALDQALRASGIAVDDKEEIFDENTAAEVVQFQAKYGIRQTGYVGPITRAKLNSLYGCPPNFPPIPPPFPPLPPTISYVQAMATDKNVIYTGEETRIFGKGFSPNSSVTVFINDLYSIVGSSASGQTNTDGTQITFIVPKVPAGNYVIYVTEPSSIVSNAVNVTIKVPGAATPTITVLSPNGGESFNQGSQANITWTSNNNYQHSDVDIGLLQNGTYISTIKSGSSVTTNSANNGSHVWTVPTSLVGSVFKIRIGFSSAYYSAFSAETMDTSDAPFSIVAGTTTIAPLTLTSISPASGPVGTSVRLDGCGPDSTSGFTLVYTGPKNGTTVIPVETLGAASGCGYMTFTVPADFPAGAYTLSVKNNQTGAMSTNSLTFAGTAVTQTAAKCTTSFSPNAIKIGDFTTWNFAAGAGDTTFQYNCSSGFTKADGTAALGYGPLPLSGAWSIRVPGPLDCTLDSYNPNVTGSGSQCRASVAVTFFDITTALLLPNASVNTPYSTTLATTNVGTAPYQWSWSPVSGGALPAGLTLNTSTGVISGTPTTAGKYSIAISVTNAAGNLSARTFTLYIDAQAGVSTKCTTSISKIGDIYTWNFQRGAGDTTFQYSCSSGFTKEDGTTALGFGQLPASGPWHIRVPAYGYIDCTLDSYNPSVIGSGSQCRANSYGLVLGNSTSQAPTPTFSYVWNNNLQIGSPFAEDVKALQTALSRDGEYAGDITGGFYTQTYLAVKAFQQKYDIEATGYVGPLTRSQLNTLYSN